MNKTRRGIKIALLCSVSLLAMLLAACASSAAAPVDATTETPQVSLTDTPTVIPTATATNSPTPVPLNPLTIESMRQRTYPGSAITFEQTLAPGANYKKYIVSYRSDGLKIYALMTIPTGAKPKTGWPVVVFNHGYIPPAQYKPTERYIAYQDAFARNGYIVFRSDYRGNGNSEGNAKGGYGSPDYTIDVLNAVASVKQYRDADPNRIGMWGHSMGGQMTLRAMVISKDIKAGVIWSGVVAPYADLLEHWRRRPVPNPPPTSDPHWRDTLIGQYGTPEQNPQFWDSISPNTYVKDLSGPIQLHHSTTDPEVPYAFSQTLDQEIKAVGGTVEFYSYAGDDHNLSHNLQLALRRSVAFFDKYVKK